MTRCRFVMLVALLMLGCGRSSTPTPIVVGHVADLSGPGRKAGEQASRGIRLALEDINKDATLRPIVVRHVDTQGKIEAFESQSVRLATMNRIAALLGGTTAEEVVRMDRA